MAIMNTEQGIHVLDLAVRVVDEWTDRIGATYQRHGSSPWKQLPTWDQWQAAVLAVASFLRPFEDGNWR